MNPSRYLPRPLPKPLTKLADLAVDLRWSFNHRADSLWQQVDPELWDATGDPWLILESVSQNRLEELAADGDFLAALEEQVTERSCHLERRGWFHESHGDHALNTVAYFSMEFGLSEALPIYSGGLGVLAGDHLKTACDLGVPLVGIGLLYQQGYFRQALDAAGNQLDFHPYNNPAMLPVVPLRDPKGGWLRTQVELPGRTVHLRGWVARVGRINLYLLDSNDMLNRPGDRSITGELYGGGPELRLQQEIILGIGGWRLLRALGLDCEVCHLNEGHAAFAVLERARSFMLDRNQPFDVALRVTRAGNLFTTHTPVAAGFDRFDPGLMTQYLSAYAEQLGIPMAHMLGLGRHDPHAAQEPFNMAYLALRGSNRANGVSRLHGAVSRRIFQPLFPRRPVHDVPVGHVTNGVHVPSWDSAFADRLWTEACGDSRWRGTMETLERDLRNVTDEQLWSFRSQARQAMVAAVRDRLARQRAARGGTEPVHALDPNTFTMGFARRFAAYKRPNLLLHDPERLLRLLTNPDRPVQLVIAGKAHPRDDEGKRMVREWAEFMRRPEASRRAVFVEDYDMSLAAELVQGIDLWINTPRRPWEASGTSGMKVLVNGGLNLSELDGWWAEAHCPEVGWALGDGKEHDSDPAWDATEAEELYRLLEEEVIPAFYSWGPHGIPAQWVTRMRESMARLTPQFSSNRMLREYCEDHYLPAAAAFRRRAADECRVALELEQWHTGLSEHWSAVRFGSVEFREGADGLEVEAAVYLGELDPDAVRIEVYADPADDDAPPTRVALQRDGPLAGAVHGYHYNGRLPAGRPREDYTLRAVPDHPEAQVPLEAPFVLWQH